MITETADGSRHKATVSRLIELFQLNQSKLADKQSRKKEVWQNISATLQSEGLNCVSKFSSHWQLNFYC